MYKKAWCTCKIVVLLIEPFASSFNSPQTNGISTLQKQWSLCPCECIKSSKGWSLLQILRRLLGWSFWRGIQGQQVRFPVSLIHYLNWLALCSYCELFLRKVTYKEGKFHRQMPNKFQGKSLTLTEHSPPAVFVTVTVSKIVRFLNKY